jgi:putative tricarboxylic transport membrane protein
MELGRDVLGQKPQPLEFNENRLTLREVLGQLPNITISSLIGCGIGALPGLGGSTGAFLAYAQAQKRSKDPESFGKGVLAGIAAPESANNAVCGGALIPMLTLGIPGDVVTAILVGAFIAHGLKPGPLLFTEHARDVYGVYVALLMAILMLAVVGELGIRLFVRVLDVRKSILFPVVLVLCTLGTYSYHSNAFDCITMVIFGLIGYAMRKLEFPLSPLVIAFILGPEIESSLRQSLIISNGSLSVFLSRPLSLFLVVITVVSVCAMAWKDLVKRPFPAPWADTTNSQGRV